MIKKISKIFENHGVEVFGFCDFLTLKDKLLNCAAIKRIPENSSTIITCLFPYKVLDEEPLNISRYAAVEDYHLVCGDVLGSIVKELEKNFPSHLFSCFIDNSPIPEIRAAAMSGLGIIGKNNLLINERFGSYVFIGEIVTTLKLPIVNKNITNCITCNKCIEVCPTGYLSDKNKKCLSKITQQKNILFEDEKCLIRKTGYIWGCDECQRVCPLNLGKEKTNIKSFINSYREKYVKGEDISRRAFEWRGEEVILRNAKILDGEAEF